MLKSVLLLNIIRNILNIILTGTVFCNNNILYNKNIYVKECR